MNIGVRLHDTAPGVFWERLCRAKAQGFDGIHLALSKTLPRFDMADAPRRLDAHLAGQLRDALTVKNMACTVLGCYLSPADRDFERLERTREIYRAHLAFAPKIGARVVGTETPVAPGPGPDAASDEALECLVECLRPLAQYAGEVGATLAIEPVADHIVNTPERAERVLDALKSDSVAVILDAVNLLTRDNCGDADAVVEEAIRRLGDRISVLHLKDYQADPARWRVRPVACGTGVMDFDRLLRFAQARNLPVILENTNPGNAGAARQIIADRAAALK